ncbi:pleckstrin homology domain-containing family F member 2-like [Uloborus diversus]|uniref:pleckstrin homology domain-containing family F member 2-like n=1 Tax=Uloborus diversus TaxID=327109 RepID=UPI0024098641|nr:pleckstrin homology domain-containing family F member 2-like [Uloborus diversus]
MVDRLVNSEANARRIATVENCFGTSGQPLAIQGRVLVGEGVLTKMCRKKAKPRQFFLFNDILVYGNIVMDKKMYNKQHIIPLEEVKLENLDDDGILKNGWLIRTPTKSFAVYAATATEKTEWMAHINKCVDDLLKKTGKKPSLEHAAVWIPDAEASICMHCRKTQFTVLNRRHHCRKCGAVVCNSCSNKKFLLPAQSSKPLRVCLSCYDTLYNCTKYHGGSEPSKTIDKPSNQDSSGEDDSEDELDDGKLDDTIKNIRDLSLDDKPTFYNDSHEVEEAQPSHGPCAVKSEQLCTPISAIKLAQASTQISAIKSELDCTLTPGDQLGQETTGDQSGLESCSSLLSDSNTVVSSSEYETADCELHYGDS